MKDVRIKKPVLLEKIEKLQEADRKETEDAARG